MHMKKLSCLLVLSVLAAPAWAECIYPKDPGKMPNGRSATREEMLDAQRKVKAYQAEMSTYLTCIKQEHDADLAKGGATMTDEQKQAITKRYVQKNDAAVDAEQEVAERFNTQRTAYLDKSKKD
jgi:hypothetical protein